MVHVKLLLLPSFVTGFLKNFSSLFILVQLLIPPEHYASVTNLYETGEREYVRIYSCHYNGLHVIFSV